MKFEQLVMLNLIWNKTENSEFPYETKYNSDNYKIRINDFPEEEMYTLIKNAIEIANFDNWPELWVK